MKRKASTPISQPRGGFRDPFESDDATLSESFYSIERAGASIPLATEPADKSQIALDFTSISPDKGDLQLEFQDDDVLHGLLAERRLLCRASFVFKALLGDGPDLLNSTGSMGFKNDSIRVIRLPDDDLETMRIVMNTIYNLGHKVPDSLDFRQLELAAIVCERYHLLGSLGA